VQNGFAYATIPIAYATVAFAPTQIQLQCMQNGFASTTVLIARVQNDFAHTTEPFAYVTIAFASMQIVF
jgi:hypothetical protein